MISSWLFDWYFRRIKYTVFICGTCHFFYFSGWIKFVMSNHRVTTASGVFDHELQRDNLMFRWTRGSPGSYIYQVGKFTVDPSPTGGKNQRSLSGSPRWQKFNSTSSCSIRGALGKCSVTCTLTHNKNKYNIDSKWFEKIPNDSNRFRQFHMLSNESFVIILKSIPLLSL